MSDTIRIGLEDDSDDGLKKMAGNLDKVADEADAAEKQLNQAGAAAKKLGDGGSKDTKKLSLQVTELNSGLELIKKGIELSARAVGSLAESGNPAAQSLIDSFTKLQDAANALGDNKNVSDAMQGMADIITNSVIPAVSALPKWFADTSAWMAKIGTQAAEFTGFFPEGTSETLEEDQKRLEEIAEAQRQINEEKRKAYIIEGKAAELEERAAADRELSNIARLESERQLKDLLELEVEARRELVEAGETSGKKLEASDRRLEVIQRRLAELPQKRAEAESKAANDAAEAKIDAEERYQEAVKASAELAAEQNEARMQKLIDEANSAADRLLQAVAQAKGQGGGNLLDETRAGISKEATRAQLVKQAQDAARQKFIEENRGKVDLEGRAWGDNETQRRANQRQADRAIELAQRQAGSQAFRDFNAGNVSQEQIAGAQNALIQNAARQAQSRGELDGNLVQALSQATQNQQQLVMTQEQQAQQVRQLQAALSQLGNAAGRNAAASRRSLLGN